MAQVLGPRKGALSLRSRRSCEFAGISRSVVEYRSRRQEHASLWERILAWARERTRYGYRRIHALLQPEGWAVHRRRVYRIYREEAALSVRRRKRRQVAAQSIPEDVGLRRLRAVGLPGSLSGATSPRLRTASVKRGVAGRRPPP
jgi:hypothetical protein